MNTKKNAPLGVTRINAPENHAVGWMARVQRGKERRAEFFSDKDCGGSQKAKAAGLRQVKQWRAQMPAAVTSHRGVRTRRNKSGEVNLYKRVQTSKENPDVEYKFWAGIWAGRSGRRHTKCFSCHKYTEAGAKRLAQIARDLRTAEMEAIAAEYRKRHGGKLPGRMEA
jgi:hypothetical protein